jgi:DNA polymerase-3 subunit gamma/tau
VSYQVFARKYRPKTFDDVLGQDHVVRTLRNAIAQNRLAHAYLFVGPRGTGKTSTARIFAKALNCPGGPSAEFDPEDEICRAIAEGNSLDVLEIDGASNNGVDEVRDLREKVKYAPAVCRFKIYYIDEVHMLSTAAFNALLKTLEEPPAHVKFIFATTEPNKILPTIISRCQRFDLRRIPNTVIAKHLLHIASLEKVSLDEKAAHAIAKGADGGMRDAQSMLDQLVAFCGGKIAETDVLEVFGLTSSESVARLAQSILDQDTVSALREVHDQSESGKDLSRLLGDMIQHFRTVLVQQSDPEAAAEDLAPEVAAHVQKQAAQATTEQLLHLVDGLAEVDARMRWAGNKRLHLELGVIQAVQSLGEVSLSDVIEAIDRGGAVGAAPATVVKRAAPPAASEPQARAVVPAAKPSAVEQVTAPVLQDAPTPALEASTVTPPASDAELWAAFKAKVDERRPLVSGWLNVATLLSKNGPRMKIGFPTSESHARDSLMRDATKKFLEEVLRELTGSVPRLEFVIDASLKTPEPADIPSLFEPPPAMPKAEPARPSSPESKPPTENKEEEFYNDPLIKAAVEAFKGRIVSKTKPA